MDCFGKENFIENNYISRIDARIETMIDIQLKNVKWKKEKNDTKNNQITYRC